MRSEFDYIREKHTKDRVLFLLRPARPIDSEVIEKNINSICREHIYLYTESFVITKEWQQVFDHSVNEESGHLLILAQVEDDVIGHLRLFPEWYGIKGRHVASVGLAIIKPWRERGIGTAMINYALDWIRLAQFKKLIATVFASNERALELFTKFGFVQEGRRIQQLNIAGHYVDEILLGWFLN